ncbi:MAG: hypothetical protein H7Z42_19370 [Roseiflexaceae bacterium]|nr:hypothetical protein [Roseiflexaceae bacterium]
MIMSGSKQATIHQVQLIDIHGTRFYDLAYAHTEAPAAIRTTRVGAESVYEQPQAGDQAQISYLMNVVVAVARLKQKEQL